MKPIEAGCRARIINSITKGANGTIVNVIGRPKQEVYDSQGKPITVKAWEIDEPIRNINGLMVRHVRGRHLERIDDYDGNQKITWEDMADIWQPETEKALQNVS